MISGRFIKLIDPQNIPSQKVAEKIGMRFERESRDQYGSFWVYAAHKEEDKIP